MGSWVKGFIFSVLIGIIGVGCGKDDKSSADRDAEIKKVLQEGMAKEKKMYEGMQKGVENLEKNTQEQKGKEKK